MEILSRSRWDLPQFTANKVFGTPRRMSVWILGENHEKLRASRQPAQQETPLSKLPQDSQTRKVLGAR